MSALQLFARQGPYLTESSRNVNSRTAEPIVVGNNFIYRIVLANNTSDEVLRGIIHECDHCPDPMEPPHDKLGIRIQSPIVENGLVDAIVNNRICAFIERREEPITAQWMSNLISDGHIISQAIYVLRRTWWAYFLNSRAC
jgi:hypothetical protein